MAMALSADGNTAVVGGAAGDEGVGAVSVFTRNGGQWSLDRKLVGKGAVGKSAPRSRCPPMALSLWSADPTTGAALAPHGCSPASSDSWTQDKKATDTGVAREAPATRGRCWIESLISTGSLRANNTRSCNRAVRGSGRCRRHGRARFEILGCVPRWRPVKVAFHAKRKPNTIITPGIPA